MRKLISILLLSFYLVSTTELYQFLKMPLLIEHYLKHKNLNHEMSFNAFLKAHYGDPVKDNDSDQDKRLPFVSHNHLLSVVFVINSILDFHCMEKISCFFDVIKTLYKSIFYHKEILDFIWEPPKI